MEQVRAICGLLDRAMAQRDALAARWSPTCCRIAGILDAWGDQSAEEPDPSC
jgi:hypothetical protein